MDPSIARAAVLAGRSLPVDDGAADHLPGVAVPAVELTSTAGVAARADRETAGRAVLVLYPDGGTPETAARLASFRVAHRALLDRGVRVFGVGIESLARQEALVERMRLPFDLWSDASRALTSALLVPVVPGAGPRPMTWYVERGRIEKVWYPVPTPERDADAVLDWLDARDRMQSGDAPREGWA